VCVCVYPRWRRLAAEAEVAATGGRLGGTWRQLATYTQTQKLTPTNTTSPAAEPELRNQRGWRRPPMAEAEQELQTDGDDREGGAYDGVGELGCSSGSKNSSTSEQRAAPPGRGEEQLHNL